MPIDRIFSRYRAVLCGATLLMVAMSGPLWVDDPDFPRVPFFAGGPVLPPWISWLVLAGIGITLALATLGRGGRAMIGAGLAFVLVAVVSDQNRLQAWIYQYLIIGMCLSAVSKGRALNMARWYTIGLYAYSGLSKLDASFCRELGPTFLSAGLKLFGVSTTNWPDSIRTLAVLAIPGFEVVIAVLLAIDKTRRVGLVGSILLHASLVMILGPWNLGHSAIVLVWNLAQIVENLCLFGPTVEPAEPEPDSKLGPIVRVFFGASMILPAGERLGYCDAWPAHALYASHAERSEIDIHEDDLDRFPETVRRRLGPPNPTPWRRLDLTGWSRDVRGTPLYPSGRVGNAVAEFLETRYGGLQPVRLVQWGRAAFLGADRDHDASLGLRAIRQRGDRYRINAHPAH